MAPLNFSFMTILKKPMESCFYNTSLEFPILYGTLYSNTKIISPPSFFFPRGALTFAKTSCVPCGNCHGYQNTPLRQMPFTKCWAGFIRSPAWRVFWGWSAGNRENIGPTLQPQSLRRFHSLCDSSSSRAFKPLRFVRGLHSSRRWWKNLENLFRDGISHDASAFGNTTRNRRINNTRRRTIMLIPSRGNYDLQTKVNGCGCQSP